MRRTAPATAALGLSLALALSGCFANPLDGIVDGLVEGGVEQLIENQTGVDVDINGSGASLPATWPAEVPTPNGQITFSAAAGDVFSVSITVASAEAAEAGYQALLASGFTETSSFDLGDGVKSYTASSDSYAVSYGFGPSDDGTSTVQMTVSTTSS